MEGIAPAKYDDSLGIAGGPYATLVAAAGYRSTEDKYARLPKVRFNAKDMIEHVD